MENKEPKKVRRVRYKGTHPRTYQEKYKELNPDQYSEDVEKIISQGKTPAGTHRSICVEEIMQFLNVQPGQTGVDATLGYGGHTLEILKSLNHSGKLIGLDVDPFELPRTTERILSLGFNETDFISKNINFSQIDEVADEFGPFDFIIADLGVSSMQIDNPERGFTFKSDGPLDLRLNPAEEIPASELLFRLSEDELTNILVENSDEEHSNEIAHAIITANEQGQKIRTTKQLFETISTALIDMGIKDKDAIRKTSQRCFQALRIEVNHEFDVLEQFIDKVPDSLKSGGKVAILTFHSGEDRRVKKAFKYFYREGIYSDIAETPQRASVEECNANPRARSAKLRWAIKK
jgi:16S rRNA (cytosine1402-N4)-methyltransferase